MSCIECMNMAITGPEDVGEHHHKMCPNYKTQKHPRLFYYEDAEDCWAPSPVDVDCIISTDNLDDGDSQEIQFKRVDMTDFEFDNLPEV